jgi:hypothetical protein
MSSKEGVFQGHHHCTPNINPSPQPVKEEQEQPKVTATRKPARHKKPVPKSTAATNPADGKSKK